MKDSSVQSQSVDPASLDRLIDIVMPPPVPWWPSAPGWYAIAAVLLLAIMVYAIGLFQRYRANQYRREALAELSSLKVEPESLVLVADLLKRTAMTFSERPSVAALTGEQWVTWLNGQCGQPLFQGRPAELLAQYIYCQDVKSSDQDIQNLVQVSRKWITNHRASERSSAPC